ERLSPLGERLRRAVFSTGAVAGLPARRSGPGAGRVPGAGPALRRPSRAAVAHRASCSKDPLLIPPILGLFLLLATAGVVGLALVTHLYGRWAGNAALARGSLLGAAAVAAAYGLIWIVTVATTRTRGLVLGDEVHFCGLDCHLHVSVLEVKRESDLGVRVRFRS